MRVSKRKTSHSWIVLKCNDAVRQVAISFRSEEFGEREREGTKEKESTDIISIHCTMCKHYLLYSQMLLLLCVCACVESRYSEPSNKRFHHHRRFFLSCAFVSAISLSLSLTPHSCPAFSVRLWLCVCVLFVHERLCACLLCVFSLFSLPRSLTLSA